MTAGLPPWLDDVHAFLARLRGEPFRIGVGEEARVLWLLDRLRLAGDPPQTPEAMAHWLGPVCCTSPRQQALFARELARWAADHGAPASGAAAGSPGPAPVPPPVAAVQRVARAGRWLLGAGIAAMAGIVLLVALWFWRSGDTRPAAAPGANATAAPSNNTGRPSDVGTGLSAERVLPVLVLGLFLLWQRRRPQSLARRFVAAATPAREVSLKAARRLLFTPGSLSHHFQTLRRHHEVPSGRIDVGRSLRATVRAGGAATLQFATQRRLPDYLVLIDRVSVADHAGALADVVLRRFAEEQVPFSSYDFHGDPRRARLRGAASSARGVADLADLAALHGDHPLILFTEAERFFSGSGAQTQAWVERLLAWPLTLIFTPKPRAEWGARERQLQAMGFVLLPATPGGIAGFADLLNTASAGPGPMASKDAATEAAAPLDLLSVRPDRWLRQTAPPQADIDELLAALQTGLGAPAFNLLMALAVFPAVDAEVTLWLAHALAAGDAPLLDEESFGRLARLPWLRRGRLPDWLRQALIAQLGPGRGADIRRLCLQLLRPRGAGRDSFQLEVASGSQRTWLATLLAVLRQDEDSPLRDAVFLGFVRNDQRQPLALRAPAELTRLLRPPALGPLEWLAIGATVGATALLWRYDLALGALLWRLLGPSAGSGPMAALLMLGNAVGTVAALVLWHVAVLGRGPAVRPGWLASARVTALLSLLLAAALAVALPGSMTLGALTGAAAAVVVALLTWLPAHPPDRGLAPVVLADLIRGSAWLSTSFGVALGLAFFYFNYSNVLHGWVPIGLQAEMRLQAGTGLAAVAGFLLLAALAAGRRLGLGFGVCLAAGAGALATAGGCLALAASVAKPLNALLLFAGLGLALLPVAAWGALLVLWQSGRAERRWVRQLSVINALLLGWTLLIGLALPLLMPESSAGMTLTRISALAVMPPVLGVFVWALRRRGVPLWPFALVQGWVGDRPVTVRAPGLRLVLGCGVLMWMPLSAAFTFDDAAFAPIDALAIAPFWALVLLVPALRLAAPDVFEGTRAAPATSTGLAPAWAAWIGVPALWLLALRYDFGIFALPQLTYLFIPLAAWWAARFGAGGWVPFLAGAGVLVLSYAAGPLLIGGAPGLFLGSVIVYRLVQNSDYRQATFNATRFGPRQLGYVWLVAGIAVSMPLSAAGTGGGFRIGGFWQPYLTLLMLLVGLSGIRSRALPWALTLGLGFGLALRQWPPTGPLTALFNLVSVNYGINDPSTWVGALLALHAPRYLLGRLDRAASAASSGHSLASPTQRLSPGIALAAYLLLAFGLMDVSGGFSVDISDRLSVSVLNTPGLMVLAFLIGVCDGRAARWRVGLLLAALALAAVAANIAAGDATLRGVWGGRLRYNVNVSDVLQGAIFVAAYFWLGVQVVRRGGATIQLQAGLEMSSAAPTLTSTATPTATPTPPPTPPPKSATLPQLQFDFMDIVLMAVATLLLLLRAASSLPPWLAALGLPL